MEFTESVVAQAASVLLKEVVTRFQRVDHIVEIVNRYAGGFREPFDIFSVFCRILYGHRLVRTPCREHFYLKSRFAYLSVVFQSVDGVVSGAYGLHVVAPHESAGRHRGVVVQFVIALVEYFFCSVGVQQFMDSESCAEFEVCPVV